MKKGVVLILLFTLLFLKGYAKEKICVACIGNSFTYGATIQNRKFNSYPAQLQYYLGEGYEVVNFGVSDEACFSYRETNKYRESLQYLPDIVFIDWGVNGLKISSQVSLDELKQDYLALINAYRQLPSNPRVILLTPIRCFEENESGINSNVIQTTITSVIMELAYEQELDIVNLGYLFGDKRESHLMPDRLHPSSIGAGKITEKLYAYLSTQTVIDNKAVVNSFSLKPTEEFNFHGYRGYAYDNGGVEYRIAKPYHTAKDAPWIWRARFWGHEPQTDIALLEKGFHVVYCDVSDLYGSEEAIKRWNTFYDLAIEAGLNKKVVLEGMSRGGLIVYNWAARNTEKVACIYGDAPVVDFKSWPVGKGNGSRSEQDVNQLLKAYGFTSEKEALEWDKNPIDHAAILAAANIPMLHVVGDDDSVVPVAENTNLLAFRLHEVGYTLTVIHKPGIGHHPHSLPNPEPIVRFILQSTGYAENMCVHPVPGNEFRSGAGWKEGYDWHRVAEDIYSTIKNKKVKVLLLGNSITQGFGGDRQAVVYKPGKSAIDQILGEGNWESAGISGDKTQNLIWRLQHNNYNVCQPDFSIITIGINNVTTDDKVEAIAEGIIAVANEAKKQLPSSHIIVFGVLPAGKEKASRNRLKCDEIHSLLSTHDWGNITYINPSDWFTNSDDDLETSLYANDYLHLSKKGYSLWSSKIGEVIKNCQSPNY